jgi:transposase
MLREPSAVTPEEIRKAKRLYLDNGWSYRRIADEYGVGEETIRRNLQRIGVKPRRPGTPSLCPHCKRPLTKVRRKR